MPKLSRGRTAAALVQAGTHTVAQAAAEVGCSRDAVYTGLRFIGVEPPNGVRASVESSPLILAAPTAADVKNVRLQAGLTLKEAAALVGCAPNSRAWLRYESGEYKMGTDRWALLLLALDMHPHFRLRRRHTPIPDHRSDS